MRLRLGKCLFRAAVFFVLVSVAVSSRAQGNGSFSGIVLLDGSQPLAGAGITYHNNPALDCQPHFGCIPLGPSVSGGVKSGPDGTFTVSGVPDDTYYLCASGTQPNQLRSCVWGQQETAVGVNAAVAPQRVTLNIRTGGLVTFKVNDPTGLIKTGVPFPSSPQYITTNLGISLAAPASPPNTGYSYYAATYVGTSGSQWTYQVPVLIGVPLKIFVSTIAPMTILDQSGQPLPINTPTSSVQANDTSGATVNLSVKPSGQTVTGAVTNGADFLLGAAPGSIATVFAQGITNVTGIAYAASLPLPTQINGTSVSINGARVPLLAVVNVNGQQQVNFQVPSGLTAPGISVVVNNNGTDLPPISANLFPAFPGIITVDGSRGAIQHGSDFRLVTTTDPAIRGEPVVIYSTGLGPVSPDPGDGNPASASPLSLTVYPVLATVGGVPATVLFSGLTSGFAGLNQVNIQVPSQSPVGDVDVVLSVVIDTFTYSSPPVKLSVK